MIAESEIEILDRSMGDMPYLKQFSTNVTSSIGGISRSGDLMSILGSTVVISFVATGEVRISVSPVRIPVDCGVNHAEPQEWAVGSVKREDTCMSGYKE